MRFFSYVEVGDDNNAITVTVSEDEIRRDYYPYWYGKMCEKFGKEHVDATYSFEDCIEDFLIVNWGHEVDDNA